MHLLPVFRVRSRGPNEVFRAVSRAPKEVHVQQEDTLLGPAPDGLDRRHGARWRRSRTGTDGTNHIWLSGGYDIDGVTPLSSMEIFTCTTGGTIVLTADVVRQGGKRYVALTWSPANGGSMNVLRNGSVIGTTADDGSVRSKLGNRTGNITFQVCETDTGTCSNEVTVRVPALMKSPLESTKVRASNY